jgi:histidine triad (HIT) family protein
MTTDTLFAKIVRREIPAQIVYQDADVTAFRDINPTAPVHILIVPNKIIPTLNDATPDDERLLGKLLLTAQKLAKEMGIAESGYRVVTNINSDGGQSVYHIHLHLIGGRKLTWPSG